MCPVAGQRMRDTLGNRVFFQKIKFLKLHYMKNLLLGLFLMNLLFRCQSDADEVGVFNANAVIANATAGDGYDWTVSIEENGQTNEHAPDEISKQRIIDYARKDKLMTLRVQIKARLTSKKRTILCAWEPNGGTKELPEIQILDIK
jgi:hypothetical protein